MTFARHLALYDGIDDDAEPLFHFSYTHICRLFHYGIASGVSFRFVSGHGMSKCTTCWRHCLADCSGRAMREIAEQYLMELLGADYYQAHFAPLTSPADILRRPDEAIYSIPRLR